MPRFLKDQKRTLIFAGLVIAQLVLISVQVPFGEEPTYFEKAVFFVFSPVEKAVHGLFATAGRIWTRYVYLGEVEAQNQKLRDDVFHLRQTNTRLQNEIAALRATRDLEQAVAALDRSFVVAAVIAVDAANIFKSIVIDKGTSDGIRVNMPVLDDNARVVGRVVNPVAGGEATVQLVTDDNSAVAVRSETSRVQGVLAGDAKGGTCWLRYVLATNEQLAEGEELTTSGFDKIYPPGLRVGRVVAITTNGSLFKKIAVKPFFRFAELGRVAVLTDGRTSPGRDGR